MVLEALPIAISLRNLRSIYLLLPHISSVKRAHLRDIALAQLLVKIRVHPENSSKLQLSLAWQVLASMFIA
jgi:hypothetical protein